MNPCLKQLCHGKNLKPHIYIIETTKHLHNDDLHKKQSKGNDILYGGSGDDTFHGGEGADIFVLERFNGLNLGEQIMDFEIGTDHIRVQADWINDGRISLDFIPASNDNTVDVVTTRPTRYSNREIFDYLREHDALPLILLIQSIK